jgi:hypothetical protein
MNQHFLYKVNLQTLMGVELNKHTHPSILSCKLLLKMFVKHHLKSFASLNPLNICFEMFKHVLKIFYIFQVLLDSLFNVLEFDNAMVYDNVSYCFACLNVWLIICEAMTSYVKFWCCYGLSNILGFNHIPTLSKLESSELPYPTYLVWPYFEPK